MKLIKLSALLRCLLAVAALAATQAYALPTWTFSYTGTIDTWTATDTGTYRVTAIGAQGGHGTIDSGPYVGGAGAKIAGSFNFTAGESFSLAVGGMGSSLPDQYNGGGGGGSFFVGAGSSPLLIAGGGGGIRAFASQNGFDASITPFGIEGSGGSSNPGAPITKTTGLGLGGIVVFSWGSGGAGFFGDGADDAPFGTGGKSWANGILGGTGPYDPICDSLGGFGGGGSGSGCGGGGGGGGYSGGDGGFIGGGGGSWNTGFDQFAEAGVGFDNGTIIIEELSASAVPEPTSLALLGLGLFGLSVSRKRKPR